MIHNNQLREGNWYFFTGNSEGIFPYKNEAGMLRLNENKQFVVCFDRYSNELLSDLGNPSPIPLTPDILKKCGFNQAVDTFRFKNWFINYTGFVLSNCPDDDESPNDWYLKQDIDKPYYICFFKYLHELQNIYFILTGTELNIKF